MFSLLIFTTGAIMMNKLVVRGRKFLILAGQILMVLTAFLLAIILRFDGALPGELLSILPALILPLIAIKLTSFSLLHLFSGWWRYVSLPDLVVLLKANLAASAFYALYVGYGPLTVTIPWSVLVLDGVLCFLLMSGMRVSVRLSRELLCTYSKNCNDEMKRIVVVGSGAVAQTIVREIRQSPKMNGEVVGLVDQDKSRLRHWFQGVQVLTDIEGLGELLRRASIDQVILANPALDLKQLRRIVATCRKYGVTSKILPNVYEILNEDVSIQHVRDVKLDDLLGRPSVHLDVENIQQYLGGKRVLVTGAAGSIGQEICRQVAKFGASSIVLFDQAETPLFDVERELKTSFPAVTVIPSLSDVRDSAKVDFVFKRFRPEVVFHAAAYKHVPMSECNPVAAVRNNVVGSRNLVNAADRYDVDHFVMISTDKAVNPTNIMGASKRAAEIYVQAMAGHSRTSIVTVRFGNVLGSNGSVVPIFQQQILKGGPVTVTDPEVTRFFMTIPEAVQLVLQAGSMGHGGEIFVLDMGEPVRIVQLAEELIRLSGLTPYKDIDLVFTGLRPGEKLHEELLLSEEGVMPTSHEKICVARACRHNLAELNLQLDRLDQACAAMDSEQVMRLIRTLVPEYHAAKESQPIPISRLNIIRSPAIHLPQVAAETA
jgi:FlaA1/EpsC-like NDP-sugar epimerase